MNCSQLRWGKYSAKIESYWPDPTGSLIFTIRQWPASTVQSVLHKILQNCTKLLFRTVHCSDIGCSGLKCNGQFTVHWISISIIWKAEIEVFNTQTNSIQCLNFAQNLFNIGFAKFNSNNYSIQIELWYI